MGGACEVGSFDQHVGGEQEVFAGAARAHDGAVVADARHYDGTPRNQGPPPQFLDEFRLPGSAAICPSFVLDHTYAI